MRIFLLFIPLLLLISACESNSTPAPVFHYGESGGADGAGMHTVIAGDTPWTIARDYNLSMPDIITVNGLTPPYQLTPGTRIKLPPPSTYRARAGDTVYSISRTFGVGASQLVQLNNLRPPFAVPPGMMVRLPAVQAPVFENAPTFAAAPPQPQAYSASQPMALTAPSLLTSPDTQADVERDIENERMARAMAPPPSGLQPVRPLVQNTNQILTPSPWNGGTGHFAWPVNGPVISGYGPKPGGLHNDGINIRSPRGAPVRAADDGTVVFAGDELKGFGNLVLLRHADRWMTAYAHMDRILVKRGTHVMRGQALGAVGSTGSVLEPQLHFEVRRGLEALDPALFLGPPRP